MLKYKNFLNEDNRPIISYDFDGTLHCSVEGLDPYDFVDWKSWEPFTEVHDQLKKDAVHHKIVITTARPPETNEYIFEFLKFYKLPAEQIYATNDMPKTPVLLKMGAIKHYDDNIKLTAPLKAAGIEFVFTNPFARTQHIMEAASIFLRGGILLIKGADETDGTQKLYAAPIKNLISVGAGAKMAILADTFYRVYNDGTKLRNKLISWKNDGALAKILKMHNQSASIVLNNQKTPLHWLSLQYDNVAQMLYKIGTEISSIEGINWKE